MKKILLLALAIFALFSITLYTHRVIFKRQEVKPKRNVILVDIDLFRKEQFNCVGEARNLTPNFCKFADNSLDFQNNFTVNHWTLPSTVSTLTSLYPITHQYWNSLSTLDPSVNTITNILREEGYSTHLVEDRPFFEEFLPKMYKRFDTVSDGTQPQEWDEKIKSFSENELYFAYLYTDRLHAPHFLTKEEEENEWEEYRRFLVDNYRDIFTQKAIDENPEIFENLSYEKGEELDGLKGWYTISNPENPDLYIKDPWKEMDYWETKSEDPEHVIRAKKAYINEVKKLDADLKEFFDLLSSPEFTDNTIVAITSSHADAYGEHGNYGHPITPYNEIVHVPLVIYYPGNEPKRINSLSQTVDIVPTLISLLGLKDLELSQGYSLVPLFTGKKDEVREYAYSMGPYIAYAIQNRTWKLIWDVTKPEEDQIELYFLVDDPGELNNLANDYPERARNLKDKVHKFIRSSEKLKESKPILFPPNIDDETKKNLLKRGYF